MAKVTNAYIKLWGSPEYVQHHRIEVTFEETNVPMKYERTMSENKSGFFYRGFAEDKHNILFYDKPGNGFGGQIFNLQMVNNGIHTLIGPWSSSCGPVNQAFSNHEPLVECCTSDNHVVTFVTKALLESFGLVFETDKFYINEVSFKVNKNFLKEYAVAHPEHFWKRGY